MRFHKMAVPLLAATLISISGGPLLRAQDSRREQFRHALSMYERGLYSDARALFSAMSPDAQSEGYEVLCAATLRTDGYETMISNYLDKYPYSGLAPLIHYRYGLNLFDDEEYAVVYSPENEVPAGSVPESGKSPDDGDIDKLP